MDRLPRLCLGVLIYRSVNQVFSGCCTVPLCPSVMDLLKSLFVVD